MWFTRSIVVLICMFHVAHPAMRTRSLNGAPVTDGDEKFNEMLYELLTLTILKGINIYKIKQFNDRHFLDKTRRHYWFGDRYFRLDNYYWLSTRDTCGYRLNETQSKPLEYDEDNVKINEIFFQCLRYEEYCCGLNCCRRY
ncbi:unnamed protein product [Auanema sp. JU1783]|nr:unnamed protein product [Auanema sp. JU1783]